MIQLILLLQGFSLAQGQLYATTVNPPHACDNFGLCASNPDPQSTNYSCPAGNCVCQAGTTGPLCENILDQCTAKHPCPTTGYWDCTNTVNTPVCTCSAGYTGSNCDMATTNPCASYPCQNGGSCSPNSDNVTYTCNCQNGYLPPNCQYKNPCNPNPCQNGGTCKSIYNGANFLCTCPTGYWDRLCQSFVYQWTANSQQYQGCYDYTTALEDSTKYLKISDNKMTYSMCQNYLESTVAVPPYTMFTVMQKNCYLSKTNYLNTSTLNTNIMCNSSCPGSFSEICGAQVTGDTSYWKVLWTIDNKYTTAPQVCSSLPATTCENSTGHGMCISMPSSFNAQQYLCICVPPYVQNATKTGCIASQVCTLNPCGAYGTCSPNSDGLTYTCNCLAGHSGNNCQYTAQCNPNPCLYGGTCNDNGDGTYSCNCLPMYFGNHCEDIDVCNYANPCANGATCVNNGTGIQIWPWCKCNDGYQGIYCQTMINYCTKYQPCQYNATCAPLFKDYSCGCIPGTQGKNCSNIINNCVPYTDSTGTYKTRCNTKDNGAVCVNAINNFTCNCSSQWTGDYCDLNVIIQQVMITIYGKMDPTMLPLLNDLMQTPAMIADMVPFIIGTLTPDQRVNLSWSLSDMFYWATYEEKELNLAYWMLAISILKFRRDFVEWNDVVLGNCFTFNHQNASVFYKTRSSQTEGGLRVRLKLNQAEYEPWTDTAAILVFIHYKDDYIMSESVRYNAEPDNEVVFFPLQSQYTRLGGQYGTCIKSTSQVKAFYFPGEYTTDGCLRSCYQDMVIKSCGCMDPRYPMPPNVESCSVSNSLLSKLSKESSVTCIDDAAAKAGDPSTWPTCVCPLPCENTDFSITWSKVDYRAKTANCLAPSNYVWDPICQDATADSVIVQVTQPEMTYQLFQESPTMDFNHLIGSLGALLGVLMGICAITFVEIFVMLGRVCVTLCGCCRKEDEKKQNDKTPNNPEKAPEKESVY